MFSNAELRPASRYDARRGGELARCDTTSAPPMVQQHWTSKSSAHEPVQEDGRQDVHFDDAGRQAEARPVRAYVKEATAVGAAHSFENVLVADGVNPIEQEKENRAPSEDTNWQRCELLPRSAKRTDCRPFPRYARSGPTCASAPEHVQEDGQQDVLFDDVGRQAEARPVRSCRRVATAFEDVHSLENVQVADGVNHKEQDRENRTPS